MARDIYPPPLSKTAKYKKITKPLLERKRRARINRCLDELKDLMVGALEIDDDNMSKLEKADILELTVNHLTKLHSPRDPVVEAKKFQAGFGQCAAEACRFILALPDLDAKVSQNLVNHLSRLVGTQPLTIQVPNRPTYSPPISPPSPAILDRDRNLYYSDERSSSDGELEDASPYADRYPDDVSQYSASSAWSQPERRMPSLPIKTTPSAKELASPMSGLLTTVDRVSSPPRHPEPHRIDRTQRSQCFNRVPAECKDIILQKIRQHIMDKRGNDIHGDTDSYNARPSEEYAPKISVREGLTRSDRPHGYNQVSNDTLDLRKVRSPPKVSPEKRRYTDSPPTIDQRSVASPLPPQPAAAAPSDKLQNPPITNASSENKAESTTVNLPEQLAVDYSNLPPKKKRKLLEYQEYKKQEESRRLEEIANRQRKEYLLMNGHPDNGELDASNPAWRPW